MQKTCNMIDLFHRWVRARKKNGVHLWGTLPAQTVFMSY